MEWGVDELIPKRIGALDGKNISSEVMGNDPKVPVRGMLKPHHQELL